MWWALYVEDEGIYCLLCRKHHSKANQNKSETFSAKPSTRFKLSTLNDHAASSKHKVTVKNEMLNRVSIFQQQIDEKELVKNDVLEKAFYSIYWLAKEAIANRKLPSLLSLIQLLGVTEMKYLTYRSATSIREMFNTLGNGIRDEITTQITNQPYGLLVDDVADISNEEQMVGFIQYIDRNTNNVECKFLFSSNVLEKADSANAEAMYDVIKGNLQSAGIPLDNMRGLATDGASVMTGKNNGLAAIIKKDVPMMISVHCICHKLA
ncbi:protein ZBED8-like [Pecten maximus]|uniref:protein ZBED8-like n=1 Tax=Pecten maximus TaxID=6579 RepID=UPI00145831D7|nr:protein ZBED8-like [Pecten maximus]